MRTFGPVAMFWPVVRSAGARVWRRSFAAADPTMVDPRRVPSSRRAKNTGGAAASPKDRARRWVRPELPAEIAYRGVTTAGELRHASFKRPREQEWVAEAPRVGAPRPEPPST
jgi:hypothetical protein